MTDLLTVENTTAVANVHHRLALGVQWIDALTRQSAAGDWQGDLESIGTRPCALRWDVHPQARLALRHAGRLARLLALGAADKAAHPPPTPAADPTNFALRAWGRRSARLADYATGNDPRRHVPRRLALTPAQSGGVPAGGTANIRTAWLWPGANWPLPSHATALRGFVRRGASDASARPVAWTRAVVTRPLAHTPNFAAEDKLGYAHGDDRGEFLVVLPPAAIPGGVDLPSSIALRLWVFLPPADAFEPADPLASLPLEVAGTDPINDVLRGTAAPPAYLRQAPLDIVVAPGTVLSIDPAALRFT